jgi:hypothetical protein
VNKDQHLYGIQEIVAYFATFLEPEELQKEFAEVLSMLCVESQLFKLLLF